MKQLKPQQQVQEALRHFEEEAQKASVQAFLRSKSLARRGQNSNAWEKVSW
jgi:hypothetical protein